MHLLSYGQESDKATFRRFSTALGHSHNDYLQNPPFFKSFDAGMSSIEADVFLLNGKLYVAHTADEIDTAKTFDKLYLKPLQDIMVKQGRPFAEFNKPLQLVIDIKENHQQVLSFLIAMLAPHLNHFDKSVHAQAIQLVISGDRPHPRDFYKYPKWISFDGRPDVDYSTAEWQRIAMISVDIKSCSDWNGEQPPSTKQIDQLKRIVKKAHDHAKPFRFWGNKDNLLSWRVLRDVGVDWINTDDPEGLAIFLASPDVTK